jgi:hypothetical protein
MRMLRLAAGRFPLRNGDGAHLILFKRMLIVIEDRWKKVDRFLLDNFLA